jgi:hypothetical protein
MSVIIKLLSKFDDSGIKKAKSSFGGLSKTLGAVGLGIGIKQITDLLFDAAKAASADAKSTNLLNVQLVKNAGATDQAVIANGLFIEKLSLATGIMDDDLRPAMGKLVRATGDVETAQDLLTLSLDAATVAGKPLDTVAQAMARAFTGNKTALIKLFPSLKTSTDLFGDLEKIVGGAAIAQADPFMLLNNSMDILKEKLGVIVLPLITGFIEEISAPGGAIEVVGQFFDDLANPKSDVGKTFTEIKDAVGSAIENVKTFFGYFGDGNAVKGFGNIVSGLISALPALLALKGIMMLASAGKSIANLAKAIALMTGAGAVDGVVAGGGKGGKGKMPLLGTGALLGVGMVLSLGGDTKLQTPEEKAAAIAQRNAGQTALRQNAGTFPGLPNFKPQPSVINNVTINATNADPKAVVEAVGKYIKQNGSLPYSFGTGRVAR